MLKRFIPSLSAIAVSFLTLIANTNITPTSFYIFYQPECPKELKK